MWWVEPYLRGVPQSWYLAPEAGETSPLVIQPEADQCALLLLNGWESVGGKEWGDSASHVMHHKADPPPYVECKRGSGKERMEPGNDVGETHVGGEGLKTKVKCLYSYHRGPLIVVWE